MSTLTSFGADIEREAAARDARIMRLTPRWTPLNPHHGQQLYAWSPVRFKVNPSGRRSGKTEIAKRKGVSQLPLNRAHPFRGLYGAPTHDQARTIFWDDLQALIPPHWIRSINNTRLEIVTTWGAMLRVFGFDRPQRMEGVIWDWICLDEMADCKRDCFKLNIRPALSTLGREGGADLIGVPDEVGRNQAEYEELWKIGLRWSPLAELAKDPDVCSFRWPSSDILAPSEVTAISRNVDPLVMQQEYGGLFVRSSGKVLPRFDDAVHVQERYCVYHPELPLDWSMDFGTTHVAHLIGQQWKGRVWILDEIAIKDSSTEVAATQFLDLCQRRNYSLRNVRIFGDAAGNTPGSNIGKSDYEIIDRAMRAYRVDWNVPYANPLVKDTVNAVRGRVVTADGIVHLHIHPRCVKLINDCEIAPWPDGSNRLKAYHWLACLRYYLYELFGDLAGRMSTGGPVHPNLRGGVVPPPDRRRAVE